MVPIRSFSRCGSIVLLSISSKRTLIEFTGTIQTAYNIEYVEEKEVEKVLLFLEKLEAKKSIECLLGEKTVQLSCIETATELRILWDGFEFRVSEVEEIFQHLASFFGLNCKKSGSIHIYSNAPYTGETLSLWATKGHLTIKIDRYKKDTAHLDLSLGKRPVTLLGLLHQRHQMEFSVEGIRTQFRPWNTWNEGALIFTLNDKQVECVITNISDLKGHLNGFFEID